ncbi:MAG: DUF192 domain-containing protein [Erythrobacter sp.]|uniref:DUF192 domain-containing protein n=1 Tax=Erythrobacter sp. TaxID=1042 RepID=UPI002617AA93|nr:DUF192 domain-containing protein [Erythrobacter sp.]MDJ0979042.1 DUF192 domain-containing protein [Erythrobacter sp.]
MIRSSRRTGDWRGVWAVALALLVAACSPVDAAREVPTAPSATQAADASKSAVHPISGLQIAEVTVVSGGKRFPFKTELALSREAQTRGLMFREALADDEAMLFPNDSPQMRSFWMKNTPISLDIIFIGPDRRITNIATAVPYSLDSVPSESEVIAVFEIRGGLAQELGIKPGDSVEWELP